VKILILDMEEQYTESARKSDREWEVKYQRDIFRNQVKKDADTIQ
jgi:hypothetical protein